jgi:hypothetical protein
MDGISQTIEALADSIVEMRHQPNARNTIVQTLHGLVRIAINCSRDRKIEMNVKTNEMLDDLFHKFRNAESQEQR